MRAVIVGAGEIGYHIAKALTEEQCDVVLIDKSKDALHRVEERLDLMTIHGSGSSPVILEKAGVSSADFCIAVTHDDDVNVIASIVAQKSGVLTKIARVSSPDYFSNQSILSPSDVGIDLLVNPEMLSAEEFLRLLSAPEARELVEFAQGRVQLIAFQVRPDNDLRNRSIEDLRKNVIRRDLLFAAVKKPDGSVIIPKGNNVIREGDELFAVGSGESIAHLMSCSGASRIALERVVINGAGRIGLALGRMVEESGAKAVIIEKDRDAAQAAAEQLAKADVIHGDVHDEAVLEAAAVDAADGFVSVTGDDDSDVMACVSFKKKGCPRVLTLIQKPRYLPIIKSIPMLDGAVSRHLAAVGAALKLIRRGNVISVAALHEIDAEALELVARRTARAAGKELSSLDLPEDAIIGAIVRDGTVIIPKGADMIMPGDRVVVFCLPHAIQPVERLFSG